MRLARLRGTKVAASQVALLALDKQGRAGAFALQLATRSPKLPAPRSLSTSATVAEPAPCVLISKLRPLIRSIASRPAPLM